MVEVAAATLSVYIQNGKIVRKKCENEENSRDFVEWYGFIHSFNVSVGEYLSLESSRKLRKTWARKARLSKKKNCAMRNAEKVPNGGVHQLENSRYHGLLP